MKKIKIVPVLLVILFANSTTIANHSQDSLKLEISELKKELEIVKLELEKSRKVAQLHESRSIHNEITFKRAMIIIFFTVALLIILVIFIYKYNRFKRLRTIAKNE